jgi:hypothetical protein
MPAARVKRDFTAELLKSFWTKAESLKEAIQEENPDSFVPSGIQEDMIMAFAGAGGYVNDPRICAIITANKMGKTACIIGGILKNIFWGPESDFYNYEVFKKFPFPKDGRIVGTKENLKEGGPIDSEILKWWPRNKYERFKDGHNFFSRYEVEGKDGIYKFDVLSYDQDTKQFEGPVKGWTICDEPPPPKLLGPILSRFYIGGILLLGFTPIKCGLLMNWLEDFKIKGVRTNIVTSNIYANSITKGKQNSTGTKRGLMSDEQIKDYVLQTPESEKDARIEGKANNRSGKVYQMFDISIHSRPYDIMGDYLTSANHYMVMDPHRKYYPFMQWWAVTKDEKIICYNEWPTVETFHGKYYDEIRNTIACNLGYDDLSTIIKLNDMSHIGYVIRKRWIDPRFAKGTEGDYTSNTLGLVAEYGIPPRNIKFELPPFESISAQRSRIMEMMKVDRALPSGVNNEPQIYFLPHCKNSIRSFERHSWVEDEGKETEDETFKDPCDCARIFLGGLGKIRWIDFSATKRKLKFSDKDEKKESLIKSMSDVGLS